MSEAQKRNRVMGRRIYTGRPKQAVVWEGVSYSSYREAARALGVSVETVRQRHLRGQKGYGDFKIRSKYTPKKKTREILEEGPSSSSLSWSKTFRNMEIEVVNEKEAKRQI